MKVTKFPRLIKRKLFQCCNNIVGKVTVFYRAVIMLIVTHNCLDC